MKGKNMKVIMILIVICLFIVASVIFYGQNKTPITPSPSPILKLPDTTENIIVAFGDIFSKDWLDNELEFIAKHYFGMVNPTQTQASKLKSYNNNFVALPYKATWVNKNDVDFESANKNEFLFWHSTCPAGLILVPQDKSVALYWNKDGRGANLKYNVYRSNNATGTFYKINKSGPLTATQYMDSELDNNKTYYYKIMAVDTDNTEYDYSFTKEGTPGNSPSVSLREPSISIQGEIKPYATIDVTFTIIASGLLSNVSGYIDIGEKLGNNRVFKNVSLAYIGNNTYSKTTTLSLSSNFSSSSLFYYFKATANDGKTYRLPEKGSFTTFLNNRIEIFGGYLGDFGSEKFQRHWVNEAIKQLSGYDGIQTDGPPTRWDFYNSEGEIIVEGYSEATFRQDATDYLNYLRTNIPKEKIIFQNIGGGNFISDALLEAKSYAQAVDVVGIESFTCGWGGYRSEEIWKKEIDYAIYTNSIGKGVILVPGVISSFDDIQCRMLSFCSYLVAKGSKTYFAIEQPVNLSGQSETEIAYFPEWTINIGKPIVTKGSVEEYKSIDGNYYKREFTNGIVLINTKETRIENIKLGGNYYKVVVNGGISKEVGKLYNKEGQAPYDGEISYDGPISQVTLEPAPLKDCAIVLLKQKP